MEHWLERYLAIPADLQAKLLETLLTLGGLWLIHRLSLTLVYRRSVDPWTRYRWRKSLTYLASFLGVVLLGRIWIESVAAVATFAGLLSAGLAIALRDPIVNLAGWIYLVWRRPFEVGDRIQIGPNAGDVIDLHVFAFTLNEIGNWVDADQSTGRIVHVPNGRVFTEAVANYDRGFRYIWNEIPVVVSFESNWKLAKSILERIATKYAEHLTEKAEKDLLEASRQYFIAYTRLTPIVYTSVVDMGVRLTMRYLIQPRHRRGSEQAIWQDVLDEFAACPDIDFAYPTTRSYRNSEEGKPGTRGGAR